MGRKAEKIELSKEQLETLTMWVKAGKTEQRLVQRAKVILGAAKGWKLARLARYAKLSVNNCGKWRARFKTKGLDGLLDQPRSGKPITIPPAQKVSVLALACSTPTDGCSRWSISRLAETTGLSQSTIQRILVRGEVKPHKVHYWCGKSRDPEFEKKQAEIVGLYLNPPTNALVISVDEKSQMQVLERSQPVLPTRPQQPQKLTATYKRHGTLCLLAAFSVHEGVIRARCIERNNHHEFLAFLKYLYRKLPRTHLHVILDNLSVHKHKDVKEWVGKRRRLTLHWTPTYSSWLNQIEIWFNIFSRDVIRGGSWASKTEMVQQIMKYIRSYNQRAKPFRWTYTGHPLTR